MLMARMEPENNIEMILEGFCKTAAAEQFIVVGNTTNSFGKKMIEKYGKDERVHFAGAIFNETGINTLRKFCKLYFHGHSVGGTNPSLLEAMASEALIAAHDNEFNRSVLQEDAFYFNTAGDVMQLINADGFSLNTTSLLYNNLAKIKKQYNWPAIIDAYEAMMIECHQNKR
jgi:glycosyltransferase involved in cell wall biosynthesis